EPISQTRENPMRTLLSCALIAALLCVSARADEEKTEDTPKAAKTRKLLKKKISVEFKDTRLKDAIDEIKDEVKGLSIRLDTKGGVSQNATVTYTAKDKTVAEILDGICKKLGGKSWIIISKKGNAYDGSVQIRVGEKKKKE